MKLNAFLLGLLSLICLPVWAFSETELVQQLQKNASTQGKFTQQRFLKSLSQPITATGEFVLEAKKGLLWKMQTPFVSQLKVTPEGIFQWNGTEWVSAGRMGQSEQIKLFLGLLSGEIDGIKSHFDTTLSGSNANWTLTLTPNSLLMKQIFTQIQLKGDKLVQQIELFETQGDRTLIVFSGQK